MDVSYVEVVKNIINVYYIHMANTTKTQVFFVATRAKNKPMLVNFYTKAGKPVAFEAVKKVKTKEGVHFYAKPPKAKKGR